jgi:hypothetical protein
VTTISEEQLSAWTRPAFGNEEEEADRTRALIREAIDAHEFLSSLDIDVYAKGSYKNNTNVRRDSDVDVAVEYTEIILFDYQDEADADSVWRQRRIQPYSGPLQDYAGKFAMGRYKDAIGEALEGAFGTAAVTRTNKVFTVSRGGGRLDADVVPCATHDQAFSPTGYSRGIQLLADKKPHLSVVNYPQQHYDNGVAKNKATKLRFKSVVRILKNLENKLVADGKSPKVAGYLVESLAYNCPEHCFAGTTWAERVREVLTHIWQDTEAAGWEERWREVNGIKYLFHVNQRWTWQEARDFTLAAWKYVEKA